MSSHQDSHHHQHKTRGDDHLGHDVSQVDREGQPDDHVAQARQHKRSASELPQVLSPARPTPRFRQGAEVLGHGVGEDHQHEAGDYPHGAVGRARLDEAAVNSQVERG